MPFLKKKSWERQKPSAGTRIDWSTPVSNALIGCWIFSEGGGGALFDSARLNKGTLQTAPAWTNGKFGTTTTFDGASQYAVVSTNRITNSTVGSISFWIYSGSITTTQYAFGYGGAAASSFGSFNVGVITASSLIYLGISAKSDGTVTNQTVRGNTTLSANTWYHGVITGDGSVWTVYLNGVQESLTVVSGTNNGLWIGGTTVTSPVKTNVGASWGGNAVRNRMNGRLEAVCLFDRILNPTEIRQLYSMPFSIFVYPKRRIISQTQSGIAFDAASNSGYQAAQSTYTFNRTCTGTNLYLTVDVAILSAGQTVTSVVDDSGGGNVNMVFLGARSTVTSFGRIESWGLAGPATGTKSIQVNLSSTVISAASAVSYSNVNQISPTEGFNSNQATNVGAADATVSITSVADNCWIHAAVATDDASITANQTSRNNVTGAGGSGADEDTGPITPAASTAMSYTNIGALATWAIVGYAIRPFGSSNLTTATSRFRKNLSGIGTRTGSRQIHRWN